jgi:hypothetical protein
MLISVEKIELSDLKKDDNGKFAINDGKIYPRDGVFAFEGGIDGLTIAFVANNHAYCEAITVPVKYAYSLKPIDDDREQMRDKIKELSSKLDDSFKINKTLEEIVKMIKSISSGSGNEKVLSEIKKIEGKIDNYDTSSKMDASTKALLNMAKICLGKQ